MIAVATRRLDGARQRLSARRELAWLRGQLPELLAGTPAAGRLPDARSARLTRSGVAVYVLTSATGARDAPDVVVKATRLPGAADSLRRQHATLLELHAVEALGAWRELLPRPLAQRSADALQVVVETALPGRTASGSAPLGEVLRAILPLHARTGGAVTVDAFRVERWVDAPIARVAALAILSADHQATLTALRARLSSELAGAEQQTGWVHGDYWPANVLVNAQAAVTGIVDWDRAALDELALHDVLHLLLYARKLRTRQPLGAIVARQLRAPDWSAEERASLASVAEQQEHLINANAILLYWLRHVAENLRRDAAYATNLSWQRDNVLPVLDALRDPR